MDINQSIKDTSPYIKDTGSSSLYLQKILLKTERLTSALYLVTDLLGYDEPLKNKLRNSAVEVMSAIVVSNSSDQFLDDKSLSVIKKNISIVVSCLEVSFNAGVCSSMNCEILKREYEALRELLGSDLVARGAGAISIPSNFLYPSLEEIKNIIPSRGQIKDSLGLRTNQVQGSTL